MKNGWTGGQYSLLRIGLGLWLAIRFAIAFAATPGVLSAAGVDAEAYWISTWVCTREPGVKFFRP